MRRSPRTRLAGAAATLLAFIVGTSIAGPAAATTAPAPATPSTTTGDVPTRDAAPATAAGAEQDQARRGAWSPGVEPGADGTWTAYIEVADGFVRQDVGTYATRKEARKAAKKAAEEANAVMDGPGCDPPLVLC
jgi:hypothetical protein